MSDLAKLSPDARELYGYLRNDKPNGASIAQIARPLADQARLDRIASALMELELAERVSVRGRGPNRAFIALSQPY